MACRGDMNYLFLSMRACIWDSTVFVAASSFCCWTSLMLGLTSSSLEGFLGGREAIIVDFLTWLCFGGFLKSLALSRTLEPNDPTGFFGFPALAVRAALVC